MTVERRRGLSVRMRLTLSYAGFLVVAGGVLLGGLLLLVGHYLPAGSLQTIDGTPSPSRRDIVEAAIPWFARGMVFLLLVGLGGGWFLAGRMLRPLVPIDAAVRRAADGSLAHRIGLPGPDDELRRLADGFDDMLARLEAAFEEQRRFTANASHELRTPLAVTKAVLEVARTDPAGADRETLERLHVTNERAIATLEALLQLARIDRGTLASSPCDLGELVDDAVREVPISIEVVWEPTTAVVSGDPVLLGRLVANLVGNAVVHNVADGGHVRIGLTHVPGHVRLEVENSGPVVPASVVGTLTEPFVRLGSRMHASGSGLGLAIVASICDVHGASLALTPRVGGGLVVTVDLAAA